ncbi:MAG: helix-turn-helix domain-containing protein [Lachnospiraceae bacterium]|nr:helix-turn-helix domain-containing protein [Lachnospiraceae bacterium]
MIENLNGIFETVNCKQRTTLKLYDNDEYEDYPMHWHPAVEIVMPTESGYTLMFTNNKKVELKEGDICIICPCTIHAIFAPPKGRRIIFQLNSSNLRFMKDIEVLMSVMSPYTVITPENFGDIHADLRRYMEEIKEEYMAGDSFSEVNIYSKVLNMLVLIGKSYAKKTDEEAMEKTAVQDEYIEKMLEICNYIDKHCGEVLKLDNIADMSGFSKFYFERIFKQITGKSFYKYVNYKRISKAEELLVEPDNSVTDVALNCGFSSISSFIRMFKLQKGCTPTEFKSMYTKDNLH